MKQFLGNVIKFLIILAVIGAAVYAAIRYWDSIVTLVGRAKALIARKCHRLVEQEDYQDWAAE